jgi:hypothetical protein
MLNRARIMLKADVGKHSEGESLPDREIAPILETSSVLLAHCSPLIGTPEVRL